MFVFVACFPEAPISTPCRESLLCRCKRGQPWPFSRKSWDGLFRSHPPGPPIPQRSLPCGIRPCRSFEFSHEAFRHALLPVTASSALHFSSTMALGRLPLPPSLPFHYHLPVPPRGVRSVVARRASLPWTSMNSSLNLMIRLAAQFSVNPHTPLSTCQLENPPPLSGGRKS